jgi:hypothetical protein
VHVESVSAEPKEAYRQGTLPGWRPVELPRGWAARKPKYRVEGETVRYCGCINQSLFHSERGGAVRGVARRLLRATFAAPVADATPLPREPCVS